MTIQVLNREARVDCHERTLQSFILWCRIEYQVELYDYQVQIAHWCLWSILVEPTDVYIKIARQAGKTETITLLVRFLMIFHLHLVGTPLMAAFASPKGEQAKTDVDRIKKSVVQMRIRWQVEDREFNSHTVRAYRFEKLHAEIFRFSLAPTTSNESKTLNVLIVEEAHKTDDKKRSDEIDPMLASTGGVKWFIGVGNVKDCDFKKGCDGQLPGSVAVIVPVDKVIADRRRKYEQTGDTKHLAYEQAFARELRQKGRENPELKRNYYLEDMVEVSGFVSRERLITCRRTGPVAMDRLYLGLDWARKSDFTWATIVNDMNDVVTWYKYPHVRYEDQIQMIMADLERDGFKEKIYGVRGDSTGQGDMPMEFMEMHCPIPIDEESKVKFTTQSKHAMYTNFEQAIFRDEGDSMRFSYPADHPLAAEFEEQMVALEREYIGDGEYLSVHHPDEDGAMDDSCDSTALALTAPLGALVA